MMKNRLKLLFRLKKLKIVSDMNLFSTNLVSYLKFYFIVIARTVRSHKINVFLLKVDNLVSKSDIRWKFSAAKKYFYEQKKFSICRMER